MRYNKFKKPFHKKNNNRNVEKEKSKEELKILLPIYQSLDIRQSVRLYHKQKKQLSFHTKQVIKLLIANKLLYHNPQVPYEGELPDEVKEIQKEMESFGLTEKAQ